MATSVRPSHHFLVRHEMFGTFLSLLRNIMKHSGLRKLKLASKINHQCLAIITSSSQTLTKLQHWLVTTSNDRHICIDILEEHKKLPIADQLCSVVLSLPFG